MSNIGNFVGIYVPDVDDRLLDFTHVRLYRAASQSGPFTTLVISQALVSGTLDYSYQDASGIPTDWYQTEYFNSGTLSVSPRSVAVPSSPMPLYTEQTLRREVADRLGLYGRPWLNHTFPGPSGTTTAAGSTTTVVCSSFINSRYRSSDWEGWFLLMNGGTAIGEERMVDGFSEVTGTFTLATALSASSGSGNTFDLYGMATSGWWTEALNESMMDVWLPFRIPIVGSASPANREYRLPFFVAKDVQVFGMDRVGGDTIRQRTYSAGHHFQLQELHDGGLALLFPGGLSAQQAYEVVGKRHGFRFTSGTQTIALSDEMHRYVVINAAHQIAFRFAEDTHGSIDDRKRWADKVKDLGTVRANLMRELGMFNEQRGPRREDMVSIAGDDWGADISSKSRYY